MASAWNEFDGWVSVPDPVLPPELYFCYGKGCGCYYTKGCPNPDHAGLWEPRDPRKTH